MLEQACFHIPPLAGPRDTPVAARAFGAAPAFAVLPAPEVARALAAARASGLAQADATELERVVELALAEVHSASPVLSNSAKE